MENLKEYINRLRRDFTMETLDESQVSHDPVKQFEAWFKEAIQAEVNEPNAMTVATVGEHGRPSARIVLLRNYGEEGFSFYTNYNSRKGKEIAHNPFASLLFFWPELERQVRIEGKLRMQSAEESDRYFMSRPESSRIGAWASPQSEVIGSRKVLDDNIGKASEEFRGKEVTRPGWWGGYVLEPDTFEFWQGRHSRLHDRISYTKDEESSWRIARLAP